MSQGGLGRCKASAFQSCAIAAVPQAAANKRFLHLLNSKIPAFSHVSCYSLSPPLSFFLCNLLSSYRISFSVILSSTNPMAESSSAQDTEQAPESSNQPQQDERNDEVAGDESAMLLPQDDAPPSSPPPAGLSPPKAIHALTPLAISFSVSSLVFLIAAEITLAVLSRTNFRIGWQVQEPLKQLIAPVSPF